MVFYLVNNVISVSLAIEHLLTFQNQFYPVQNFPLTYWLEYFKDDKEVLKGKSMLLQTAATQLELNIEDYSSRTALFR